MSISSRRISIAIGLLLSAPIASALIALGGITVAPTPATTDSPVTIRLANSFGAGAEVASATISQSGNTFVIEQSVGIACSLPFPSVAASEFQVGPLPAGTYSVTATITFIGAGPAPCSPNPITQTASFDVLSPSQIPAFSNLGLALFGFTLMATALWVLRVE